MNEQSLFEVVNIFLRNTLGVLHLVNHVVILCLGFTFMTEDIWLRQCMCDAYLLGGLGWEGALSAVPSSH